MFEMKHCIITIRYSVLDRSGKNARWKITRSPNYASELFAPERMELREHLFANITIPSLRKFDHSRFDTFTIYVIASTELPDINKQFLESYPELTIVYQEPDKVDFGYGLSLIVNPGDAYAHVRLDDDDALLPHLGTILANYTKPNFIGHVISPACGIGAIILEGKIVKYGKFTENYIACGLAIIGSYEQLHHVYYTGHNQVALHYPVIVLATDVYWIRTFHTTQDSNAVVPPLMKHSISAIETIVDSPLINLESKNRKFNRFEPCGIPR